jgi:polysaccharide biosynthesis/export protein
MPKRVLSRGRALIATGTTRATSGRVRAAALVLACAGALAGCGSSLNNEFELMQKEQMPKEQKVGTGLVSTSASQAAADAKRIRAPKAVEDLASVSTPGHSVYKIGPLDVLDVSVFKVPELSRSVLVDESGMIDMPLLGGVRAAGKTSRDLERELAAKLGAKYLQSPQVTVYIKEYNSQRVTGEGAVKRPGVHALKGSTTLLQIIAMSGGLDTTTTDSTVVVFRNTNGKRYAAKFDVATIRSGEAQDPPIEPGDVVVANSSAIKSAWAEFLKALPVGTYVRPFL